MALNIPLLENYSLKSDSNNFIITKIENNRENVLGYYGTIEGALESLIKHKMRTSNAQTITSLLDEIKSLQQAITNAIHPLKLNLGCLK